MNTSELKGLLMQEDGFREAYSKPDPKFDIAAMVAAARIERGITQIELAEAMGVHQSSVARLESGSSLPSITTLYKVAEALGAELEMPRITSAAPATVTVPFFWEAQQPPARQDVRAGNLAKRDSMYTRTFPERRQLV